LALEDIFGVARNPQTINDGYERSIGYLSTGTLNIVQIGSTICTTSGVITITDAAGAHIAFYISAIGVPACVVAPPPPPPLAASWHVMWSSPLRDIRTYPYWNSYLTMNNSCTWINPVGAPQLTFLSGDGQWRMVGNYVFTYGAQSVGSGDTYQIWYTAIPAGYGSLYGYNPSLNNMYGLFLRDANAALGLNFTVQSFPSVLCGGSVDTRYPLFIQRLEKYY